MTVNLNPDSIKSAGAGQSDLQSRHAQIRDAAKQFEAFFLSYVLKQMQQSTLDSGLFGSGLGSGTYNEMFTDELARVMAEGKGIGLGEQLERQLDAGMRSSKQPGKTGSPVQVHPLSTPVQTFPLERGPLPLKQNLEPLSFETSSQPSGLLQFEPALDRSLGSALSLPGGNLVSALDTASPAVSQPLDEGTVSSDFGLRRDPFTGRPQFHEGVDIAAAAGSPIRAAAPGRVAFSGWERGYGNTVIIEHVNGYQTRYAHAEGFSVRAGDVVEAGQIVGTVGSTGRSTGPHLHFEVTKDGEHLNPGEIFSLK